MIGKVRIVYVVYVRGRRMTKESKIIFLSDLIDQRLRKEQEIEYYEEQLVEINRKLGYLYKERDLTKTIINLIESENIMDLTPRLENNDD